jgi:hypothetical protein
VRPASTRSSGGDAGWGFLRSGSPASPAEKLFFQGSLEIQVGAKSNL